MIQKGLFTSESVTEGHPDKICDQISDAVLDAVLKQDPKGRVACETLAGNGFIVVTGELSFKPKAAINYEEIIREKIKQIGYVDKSLGLDYKTCELMIRLNQQSADIAQGVDLDGAGDQGLMFGFAIDETPERMPLPISLSHKITYQLAKVRKSGEVAFFGPDGKAQVTLEYENGKPIHIDTIVVSTQHLASVGLEDVKKAVIEKVITPVVPHFLMNEKTKFFINPTGKFVIGGPEGDAGLTGRKIIVDTYGGFARHGGGAFSGKDATKVDRSGAYVARFIAKNIVAAGLAYACEVQLAYAIGVSQPVSIYIDTYGTGKVEDTQMSEAVSKLFNLTPSGIINMLELYKPIFSQTSAYGHFGRKEFSWEKENMVLKLQEYLKQ